MKNLNIHRQLLFCITIVCSQYMVTTFNLLYFCINIEMNFACSGSLGCRYFPGLKE